MSKSDRWTHGPDVHSSSVASWIDNASPDTGLYVLQNDGWQFESYEAAAEEIKRLASILADRLTPQDRLVIVVGEPAQFTKILFACLYLGAVPVPVSPPAKFESAANYVLRLCSILSNAKPRGIFLPRPVSHIADELPCRPWASELGLFETEPKVVGPQVPLSEQQRIAVVQYTSGSTSNPKGVVVPDTNVVANVEAMCRWLRLRRSDKFLSWAPLYHDMGLIGLLFLPILHQLDVFLMPPEGLITRTNAWLECFAKHGVTVTSAPPFAYHLLTRRVADSTRYDLSGWRIAGCGGEPIDPDILANFAHASRHSGFRPEAFCPAYGLAETTLVASGVDCEAIPRALAVNPKSIEFGRNIEVLTNGSTDDLSNLPANRSRLTSCGQALEGVRIEIRDVQGRRLDEPSVGEIHVKGPTVCPAYFDGQSIVDDQSWAATGDVGFKHDGQLFVLGRMSDRIKIRGRALYAEDIELRLHRCTPVRAGSLVVVPNLSPPKQGFTVIWETRTPKDRWQETIRTLEDAARSLCGEDMRIHVAVVPPGFIPRTTSGKPRRRLAWMGLGGGKNGSGS